MHYDTPENKYEFESKSPDNPFDEDEDDDGKKRERVLFVTADYFMCDVANCIARNNI